jgi:hypothetical protein
MFGKRNPTASPCRWFSMGAGHSPVDATRDSWSDLLNGIAQLAMTFGLICPKMPASVSDADKSTSEAPVRRHRRGEV